MRRRSKHTRTHVCIYVYILDTMKRDERSKAVCKEIEYLRAILIIYLMSIKKNVCFLCVYQFFFYLFGLLCIHKTRTTNKK
jgi:hypothetical protein